MLVCYVRNARPLEMISVKQRHISEHRSRNSGMSICLFENVARDIFTDCVVGGVSPFSYGVFKFFKFLLFVE
jgi:hypothetical protein